MRLKCYKPRSAGQGFGLIAEDSVMSDPSCASAPEPVVWLNGEFLPLGQVRISPLDRGLLYGDGLFETLRAEDGRTLYLAEHLDRLGESMVALRIEIGEQSLRGAWEGVKPTLRDWTHVLSDLLCHNGLHKGVAAVKILVTRGEAQGLGLPKPASPTVCLSAREYHGPEPAAYREGWRLHVVREEFSPPLAGHKTLNYLPFLAARQAALDDGADEAVVLDAWGNVAETAAGSLLVYLDGGWVEPETPFQLPGITIRAIARLLAESGDAVARGPLRADGLRDADSIWVTNSLMGIMPVQAVDGHPVPHPRADEAERLRKRLFELGRA